MRVLLPAARGRHRAQRSKHPRRALAKTAWLVLLVATLIVQRGSRARFFALRVRSPV